MNSGWTNRAPSPGEQSAARKRNEANQLGLICYLQRLGLSREQAENELSALRQAQSFGGKATHTFVVNGVTLKITKKWDGYRAPTCSYEVTVSAGSSGTQPQPSIN